MNTELIEQYRAVRRKHPDMPASQCLKVAHSTIKERARTIPRYAGDSVRIDMPRGEYVTVRLVEDWDADASERLQFETESASYDNATGHAPSGWVARDGSVLFNGFGHRVEWQWWTDNYGFMQFWEDGKRENSRHNAWLRARRLVSESFDFACRAIDAGYVGYVVTLHDADGDEIDNDSCWGFEAIGDYCAHEAMCVTERMMEKRAKHWARAVVTMRENARALRTEASALIAELRNLTGIDAPHSCQVLRERIAALRANHSGFIAGVSA